MSPLDNTPPHGDFVAYVERLTAQQLPATEVAAPHAGEQKRPAARPARPATAAAPAERPRPAASKAPAKVAQTVRAVWWASFIFVALLGLSFGLPGMVFSAAALAFGWFGWGIVGRLLQDGKLLQVLSDRADAFHHRKR